MESRKRGASTSKGKAKRLRLDRNASGDDTQLMQYLDLKLGELMQRMDRIESNSSIASSSAREVSAIVEPGESLIRSNESGTNMVPVDTLRTTNVYVMKPVIEQPKFSASGNLSPVRFVDKLRRYINYVNAGDKALEIALECLSGPSQKVLELHKQNWLTLDDFIRDFLAIYWDQNEQENAKLKLMNTKWEQNKGLSMHEHFAEQMESVRQLTIPLSETEIVKCIMRHFPEEIQRLWFTRMGPSTTLQAVEFLRGIEKNVINHKVHNQIPRERVENRVQQREYNRPPFQGQRRMTTPANVMHTNAWRGRGRDTLRGQSRYSLGGRLHYAKGVNWVNGGVINSTSGVSKNNEKELIEEDKNTGTSLSEN